MNPVERAQQNAEADFVAEVYGLLQSQSLQVLALLRRQTKRPLTDPYAQRLLAAIVAGFVQDTGAYQADWVTTLGILYVGVIAATARLLTRELPRFRLTAMGAYDLLQPIALERAASQAKIISSSIASDFAKVANQTAALLVADDEAPVALGDVLVALQGAMLAPNALDGRAKRIAGTEAPGWLNAARDTLVTADGHYTKNIWRTELDELVRPTHAAQEGMVRPIGQVFPNGCVFPGDTRAEPGEFINCRCYLEYL